MKEILGGSVKLFIRTVIVNIISILVVLSILSFLTALFSDSVGYVAMGVKEGKSQPLYTYYYESGEDTQLALYQEQGYTIQKQNIKILSDSRKNTGFIIAQVCTLLILISFIYPRLWDKGYKDRNLVQTGHLTDDPLKGLKMGAIANIPFFLSVPLFAIINNAPTKVFKTLNAVYQPALELIMGKAQHFSQLTLWQVLLILLVLCLTPAVGFLGYYLGYKDFSITERFIYKRR